MTITLNGTTGIDTPAIETDSLVIPTQVINGITVGKGNNAVSQNTAVGASALAANTVSGSRNTAVGNASLSSNTDGSYNTGVGQYAIGSNTTGSYNTGYGAFSLNSNTTASNNTAVGYQAGYSNTTGGYSTFIGYQAGYNSNWNSAGTAGANTCVGALSGYNLTTGRYNNFFGSGVNASGYEVTTGSKNTILGSYSGNQGGLDIRTASNYIVLSDGDGNPRGYYGSTGWYLNSTFGGGYNSSSNSTLGVFGFDNDTAVNSGAVYNIEWKMSGGAGGQYWYANYIARSGSRTLGAYCTGTSWTNSSDIVNKENITPIKYGLSTVMASNPVYFDWKTQRDADGKGISDIGFIAQEMELLVPEVVSGSEGSKGISYGNLVAIAFKAIQELKAEVDSLKAQLN